MANFGQLYDYNTSSGVVIPQTSKVKENVERAFKDIFGSDFSVLPQTINGRLIEAITMLFVDVCGVNAQNANGLNITQAVGSFLDGLGSMFGIERLSDESDYSYRSRIIQSASRGSGFASSISQAIGNVAGVTGVVVLDNGNDDPIALPKNNLGESLPESILIDPHSVFICVHGGDSNAIAQAIKKTISAGCGYTQSAEYGTVNSVTLTDASTNTSFTAKFYRPTQRYVKIEVTVNGAAYTGSDIIADTKDAIIQRLNNNSMNATIEKSEIISEVASLGKNIVCTEQTLKVSDDDPTLETGTEVERIIVQPYKFISTGETEEERKEFLENNIIVTVV